MIDINITRFGGRGASSSVGKTTGSKDKNNFANIYTTDRNGNMYYKDELVGRIWFDRSNTKEKVISRYMMGNKPIAIRVSELENKTNQKIEKMILDNGYTKSPLIDDYEEKRYTANGEYLGINKYSKHYLYTKKK